MSTYLELAVRLRKQTSVAGPGPLAVTNQTGDYGNLVDWIRDSYTEIQLMHSGAWRWLQRKFTFQTVAATAEYAYGSVNDTALAIPITRFNRWLVQDWKNPPKIYLTSAGVATGRYLIYVPWEAFNNYYGLGTHTDTYPTHITIDPQNNLVLGPAPDAIYTVYGQYRRGPQILAADGDTPEMPSDYHMAIVYDAMERYAYNQVAPETLQAGQRFGRKLMRGLEGSQLPTIGRAGALA